MKNPRVIGLVFGVALAAIGSWLWWSGRMGDEADKVSAAAPEAGKPWQSGDAAKPVEAPPERPTNEPPPVIPEPVRTRPKIDTVFTMERLSTEHARAPREEEWPELTRILFDGEDGDMVEAVKARFMVYAREKELAALADEYDNPRDIGVKQRVIEIFSGLQSDAGLNAARQVLTDDGMPPSDALVSASAVALARKGGEDDLKYIFGRLDRIAGAGPEDEAAADGLVYALGESRDPRTEMLMQEAAAGRGVAKTWRGRLAAINALRNQGSPASLPLLQQIAKDDPDARVRGQAAMLAAEIEAAPVPDAEPVPGQ